MLGPFALADPVPDSLSKTRHRNEQLTPLLAATPIALLVAMLGLSVYLFGSDASYGANQIALVLATAIAALVGQRTGIEWREAQAGIIDGIGVGLGPTLILLAVGMLIGTWILSGTVPTMIYYGVQVLNPGIFYAASALICAIVAISVGSSWTVAGTLGIGLMGIAGSFDLSPPIAAGAIVSGAYFGDKLSPMSDTTNLAAASTGVDLFEHIRHMLWTTVPSFVIALTVFALIGSSDAAAPEEIRKLQDSLTVEFHIGVHLLLPLALMLFLVYKRFPAYPSIIVSALAGAVFAVIFQPEAVARIAGDGDLGPLLIQVKGVWTALFSGYVANSGNAFLDALLTKGGMSSHAQHRVADHHGARFRRHPRAHRGHRLLAAHGDATGEWHGVPGRDHRGDLLRYQRARRGPVHGRGPAGTHVPRCLPRVRAVTPEPVAHARGLGHDHLGTHSLEHLRRLHGGDAGRRHPELRALRRIQSRLPTAGDRLRLLRFCPEAAGKRRGGRRA
jgi:Na+/H+ antiporter NhaC